ncbi:MAG: anaerobic ribonucleoside-triphosphate reductase activating protein [Candidatus Marinimicrobia bacterium]|nr:anaerobic ribonucleoside-triphosphate reductase activating protein [Candidatus Neomarinimicrobiota bacterium]
MGIKGFQGTSLLDFPGRIASLVFWGGCNLTCPFCHNPALVLDPAVCPDLDPADLLADLADRKAFIDGVVISGGEPTINSGLLPFLEEIKSLGLEVKLDTNGMAPQLIAELIAKQLVDYLAIDLKTTPERYSELHSGEVPADKLLETLRLCADAPVELEYRTTCVPGWVDENVIVELGELINGAPLWALQQYHPEHALCVEAKEIIPYSSEQVQSFAEIADRYAQRVIVRGV